MPTPDAPTPNPSIKAGDHVWIDPEYGYDQPEPWEVRAIEHGAACLVGAGWFDLSDLTLEADDGA